MLRFNYLDVINLTSPIFIRNSSSYLFFQAIHYEFNINEHRNCDSKLIITIINAYFFKITIITIIILLIFLLILIKFQKVKLQNLVRRK